VRMLVRLAVEWCASAEMLLSRFPSNMCTTRAKPKATNARTVDQQPCTSTLEIGFGDDMNHLQLRPGRHPTTGAALLPS